MVCFLSSFGLPRLDWRHITMKYTVLGVWKPSFSVGWSPAPQAHLFLPSHHHHVAHQSRTRALMDLKMRSQRMFEMWLPKDSCSVWNPYYHWDLLKFYLLFLISNDSWHSKLPTWGDHVESFIILAEVIESPVKSTHLCLFLTWGNPRMAPKVAFQKPEIYSFKV